ncbi:hypothetical protein [Bacillus mycoides]
MIIYTGDYNSLVKSNQLGNIVLRVKSVKKKNLPYNGIYFSHSELQEHEKSNEAKKYIYINKSKSSGAEDIKLNTGVFLGGRNLTSEVSLEIVDTELISQLIEKKKSIKSAEEYKFFNDYIKDQSVEEILNMLSQKIELDKVVDLLLTEETSDDGGIIALSGFYFQFLVSIEYLIDLIKGEWDYLLIDHHQDIIVLNKEKIRIVQVKTKNVSYCDVSETKMYSEWIQKLFAMDEMFEEYSQKTEFELVTNFIVKNAPTVPVEIYHNNADFNMKIQRNNFFKKIKHFSELKKYTNLLEDIYLEELLSKFKISKKDSEDYIYRISSNLGSLFNSRLKGTKEDIDFLIGYICSVCYYPTNPSIQLIDKDKSLKIVEVLRGRFESDVRQYIETEDSISKINGYITYLHNTFSGVPSYGALSNYIGEFERELKASINGGNNIYSMLSRFVERVYSSPKFDVVANHNIDNYIKELLDLTFFIKISSGGKVTIDDKHGRLLLKIIGNQKYSFFNLHDLDDYRTGIGKFIEIFKVCNFDEKRMLFNDKTLKLIFSGDFDDYEFPNEHFIELDYSDNPTQEDMKAFAFEIEKDSIAKVTYKVQIVNGSNNLKRDLLRRRTLSSIESYEEYVKQQLR